MAQFTPVGAEFVALFCAASLHGTLYRLLHFLMLNTLLGIYTVIFFAAIYLLWSVTIALL